MATSNGTHPTFVASLISSHFIFFIVIRANSYECCPISEQCNRARWNKFTMAISVMAFAILIFLSAPMVDLYYYFYPIADIAQQTYGTSSKSYLRSDELPAPWKWNVCRIVTEQWTPCLRRNLIHTLRSITTPNVHVSHHFRRRSHKSHTNLDYWVRMWVSCLCYALCAFTYYSEKFCTLNFLAWLCCVGVFRGTNARNLCQKQTGVVWMLTHNRTNRFCFSCSLIWVRVVSWVRFQKWFGAKNK